MASGANTPRSRSRSKRSTTNLANLRLAPLSSKYEASKGDGPLKSPLRTPYDADGEADYARKHPSYLQGQSAPTTPGILSRSNSKRHLGGGLSRRGSLYDNNSNHNITITSGEEADAENDAASQTYTSYGPGRDSLRADIGYGQIPKAKSEAALQQHQYDRRGPRLSGPGVPLASQQRQHRYPHHHPRGRRSGAATPTQKRHDEPDSWLTHTSAITSALVREDKGQSWITTRQSSTSLAPGTDSEDDDDNRRDDDESDDDDDESENYEQMAALAASTAQMQENRMQDYNNNNYHSYAGGSPVSTRPSRSSAWGSRYGSRPTSTRTSRLASPSGTRTPRRGDEYMQQQQQSAGYFDQARRPVEEIDEGLAREEADEDTEGDEAAIARLGHVEGFGLGNMVDRVMNFHLFGGVQREGDTTDDDDDGSNRREGDVRGLAVMDGGESVEEAQKRMEAERERRRGEKEMLTKRPAPTGLGSGKRAGEASAGWQDASWLLSVAAKALF